MKDTDKLPFCMSVCQVAILLNINRNAAYELVHRDDFPASIRSGKRILVLRDPFLQWLEEEGRKPTNGERVSE